MNILIYDRNIQNYNGLSSKIKEIFSAFNIVQYKDVDTLLFDLKTIQGAIVFINISDKNPDGIYLSNQINEINNTIQIIFYSFGEISIDIYEGTHVYYLNLPSDVNKIKKAIDIALKKLNNIFFKFSFAKITYKIPFSEIYYFESSARLIKVFTITETKIYYDRLDNIEQNINLPFIRASKSFLVNPFYITKIVDNKIILKRVSNLEASREICISKSYRKKISELKPK
ncbi:MAG: LytR/AlgR family response regulator transcription factor [Anaeroplasma sp.]